MLRLAVARRRGTFRMPVTGDNAASDDWTDVARRRLALHHVKPRVTRSPFTPGAIGM
jgi:hypothetical protein